MSSAAPPSSPFSRLMAQPRRAGAQQPAQAQAQADRVQASDRVAPQASAATSRQAVQSGSAAFSRLARPAAAPAERRGGGQPPRQESPADREELVGIIGMVKDYGDWAIGSIYVEGRSNIRIRGRAVTALTVGMEYTLRGAMRDHRVHGEAFEVDSADPYIKLNDRSIVRFIAEHFQGVGEKTARKFVDQVVREGGDDALAKLREQLLRAPWTVDLSGVREGAQYGSSDRQETLAAFVRRDLETRLGGVEGIRDSTIKALAQHLVGLLGESDAAGADPVRLAWGHLARDPYTPIMTVPGYGFKAADAIGRIANIPRHAPSRLAALVAYAVEEQCNVLGHTFLTLPQFYAAIQRVDPHANADQALALGLERGTLVDGYSEGSDGQGQARFYTAKLLEAEQALARKVAQMMEPCEPLLRLKRHGRGKEAEALKEQSSVREKILAAARSVDESLKLDESQIQALESLATARVRLHTLTAGPGCGKTALVQVLIRLLKDETFLCCAPTGKAARVLGNRVQRAGGGGATTIHSMLAGAERGAFSFNEKKKLDGRVLVVDEGTMPDLTLFASMAEAMPDTMHMLVLGDPGRGGRAGQLPSIQPGRVLADLLEIEDLDHNHLTKTHRNSGGILEVVDEVSRGVLNPVDRDSVTFSHGLADADEDFHRVMARYLDAVERIGPENVMLLMSRRQGEAGTPGWNTTYANSVLRRVCNPAGEKVPGTVFHLGDRIVIRDNMKIVQPVTELEVEVVNGDIGTLKGYSMDPEDKRRARAKWLRVSLDDGRTLEYPGDDVNSLAHAYAMTVHSAQGSEYKEVIAVVTPGAPTFINQTTIKTAFSRARDHLWIFGDDDQLVKIAATPMPRRNSGLVERVAVLRESDDSAEDDGPDGIASRERE